MDKLDCSTLKVGDKLFYETLYNKRETGYVTITKIGRKYLETEKFNGKFDIDVIFTKRNHDVQFYPDRQSYLDAKEHEQILIFLRESFSWGGIGRNLSLDQLRLIKRIIEDAQQ